MNAARALIETVRSHGVTLAIDGEQLRLSGARPLPSDIMARLRADKAMVVFELRASLPWWRDPEAVRLRFDEIAASAEYDNGADRDAAERIARECLAHELRTAGLSEQGIRSAIEAIMASAP
jgi:hypothetical protein